MSDKWLQIGTLIYCADPGGYMICELSEPHASEFVEHHRLTIGSKDWAQANKRAKLIVAAPELREALSDLSQSVGAMFSASGYTDFKDAEAKTEAAYTRAQAILAATEPEQ